MTNNNEDNYFHENIIFEYTTDWKNIIIPQLKLFLLGFSPVLIFLFSSIYFFKIEFSELLNIVQNNLFVWGILCTFCFVIFEFKLFFDLNTLVFTDNKIIFKYRFFRNFNEIEYKDIKFFVTDSNLRQIALKSKKYYRIFCDKENQSKIVEIFRLKIADLSESEKLQRERNRKDKPLNIILILIICYILGFLILPVNSFFYTKSADRHLQKFIESNYTDNKELEKAYSNYWATMNNRAFYNYRQILKINKYRKDKDIEENAEYVKSLFPERTNEIDLILNQTSIDFDNPVTIEAKNSFSEDKND